MAQTVATQLDEAVAPSYDEMEDEPDKHAEQKAAAKEGAKQAVGLSNPKPEPQWNPIDGRIRPKPLQANPANPNPMNQIKTMRKTKLFELREEATQGTSNMKSRLEDIKENQQAAEDQLKQKNKTYKTVLQEKLDR